MIGSEESFNEWLSRNMVVLGELLLGEHEVRFYRHGEAPEGARQLLDYQREVFLEYQEWASRLGGPGYCDAEWRCNYGPTAERTVAVFYDIPRWPTIHPPIEQ